MQAELSKTVGSCCFAGVAVSRLNSLVAVYCQWYLKGMFPAEDGAAFKECDIRPDYEPEHGTTVASTNTFLSLMLICVLKCVLDTIVSLM